MRPAPNLQSLSISTILEAIGCKISSQRTGRDRYATCPSGNHTNGTDNPNLRFTDEGVWNCHCDKRGGGKLELLILAGLATDTSSASKYLVEIGCLEPLQSSDRHATPRQSQVVASFVYQTESGETFAKVDRVEPAYGGKKPKGFYPYLMDGKDFVEKSGLNGQTLPLFLLPEVRSAIDIGAPLYIVEGEGKAIELRDALRAAGISAAVTIIPGGTGGKFTQEHLDQLRGLKETVILTDSDSSGRTAALERARCIERELDAQVRILDLYPLATSKDHPQWTWDVADWLDAGGTVVELLPMIETAPGIEAYAATIASTATPEEESDDDDGDLWPDEEEIGVPSLGEDAYYGLAGEMVNAVIAQTEASASAMLLQILALFGSAAGQSSFVLSGNAKQPARLYVVVVGETSKARKGTSLEVASAFFKHAVPLWYSTVERRNYLSGEAMVADFNGEFEKKDESDGQDPPFKGERLLIQTEFGLLLSISSRQGCTVSENARMGWDGTRLESIRRAERIIVEEGNYNLCLIGHIVKEELVGKLDDTEIWNGLSNRCVFAYVKRDKKLSNRGNVDQTIFQRYKSRLKTAIDFAREGRYMDLTEDADKLWAVWYNNEPDVKGKLGAFTARGESQVLRIAVAYALLDLSPAIDVPHLKAALACWKNNAESVSRFLDTALNSDEMKLLNELRRVYPKEMTADSIYKLFSNRKAPEREALVSKLVQRDLATTRREKMKGCKKPTLFVKARRLTPKPKEALSPASPTLALPTTPNVDTAPTIPTLSYEEPIDDGHGGMLI